MKLSNISFPHPVLGLKLEEKELPDMNGLYNVTCSDNISRNAVFEINHEVLSRPDILKLIEDGCAAYATEVTCSKTAYRKLFVSTNPKQKVEVKTDLFRDRVELHFFIIALKSFSYSDPDGSWHPDYRGIQFDIEKGMLLAFGGYIMRMIPRGSAGQGVNSIITIDSKIDKEGPFDVCIDSESITILLPSSTFEKFADLYQNQPGYNETFHASLAVPALVEALKAMADTTNVQYKEKMWYQAIEAKLDSEYRLTVNELDGENLLELAQKIINNPFSILTNCLIDSANTEEDQYAE
jgi:hypothetical protein